MSWKAPPKVFDSVEQADAIRSRGGRQLILLPDRVIKRQHPVAARLEYEKTRQAERIGRESGRFRVPRILSADLESGTIEFERLPNLVSLWQTLRNANDTTVLMETIGGSLATIHNRLVLPDECIGAVGGDDCDLQDVAPVAVLHGDFTTLNLFVDAESGQLQVLDWAVSDLQSRFVGPIGPCYFDLSWFIFSLFFRRYWGIYRIANIPQKVDSLLNGYFREIELPCTIDGLHEYLCTDFGAGQERPLSDYTAWTKLLRGRRMIVSDRAFRRFVRSSARGHATRRNQSTGDVPSV